MTRTSSGPALHMPRSVMAVALGILVFVLALRLGLFPGALDAIERAIHAATHQNARSEITELGLRPQREAPQWADAAAGDHVSTDEVFVVVERPPELIGGLASLQNRIHYPEIARRAGIQGRVFLQFVVERDGTPSDIVVVRGLGAGCDEEAVHALQSARFKPGSQRGEPVRVKVSLPIQFRLN